MRMNKILYLVCMLILVSCITANPVNVGLFRVCIEKTKQVANDLKLEHPKIRTTLSFVKGMVS
jgi:hypothetical protein